MVSIRSRFVLIMAVGAGCVVASDDTPADDGAQSDTSGTGSAAGSDVATEPPEPTTDSTTEGTEGSEGTADGEGTDEVTDDTAGTQGSATDSGTTGPAGPPQVVVETTLGTFVIELYEEQSPITVENFLTYVEGGFYDGVDGNGATVFHRVVPGFVIQGGGLTEDLAVKTTLPPIVNESSNGVANLRGTLSMARLPDPDTATSQFFVNVVDNPGLDDAPGTPGYAVFGEVVEGMEVVDAIVAVPTTSAPPYEDVPVEPIVMTSVTVQ